MNFPHSLVRDGLAQLDEGNFVESLPTGSPTLRAFAAWGFFAESWRLVACGLAKVGQRAARRHRVGFGLLGRERISRSRAGETPSGQPPRRRRYENTASTRCLLCRVRLAYRCPGESVSSRHVTVVATAWLIGYLWLARRRVARARAPAGFPIVAGPWPGFRSSARRLWQQWRRRG